MKWERLWRLGDWLGVLSYMSIVGSMIYFWLYPPENNALAKLNTLDAFFAFEFIMVHSGIFMTFFPRKFTLIFLLPFYGLFALGMHAAVPGSGFLYAYLAVVFFRMRFAFSNPTNFEISVNGSLSMFGVLNYFAAAIGAAILVKLIPKLGLTDQYVANAGFAIDSSSAILHAPHHFVFAIILYFSFFTLAELFALRARRKHYSKNSKSNRQPVKS